MFFRILALALMALASYANAGILDDLKESGVRINLSNKEGRLKCEITSIEQFERYALIDYSFTELDGYEKFCGKNLRRDLSDVGVDINKYIGYQGFIQGSIAICMDAKSRVAYERFSNVSLQIPKAAGCKDEAYIRRLGSMRNHINQK